MALTVSPVTPTPNTRTAGAATTLVLTDIGDSFDVDDMVVVCIACDNSNTNGAAPTISGITDSAGNTYVSRIDVVQDPGAANAGIANAIFTSTVTSALVSTDDLTITFNASTLAVAVAIWKVANDGTVRAAYVGGGAGTGASQNNPSVVTASIPSGDIVIGNMAMEGQNASVTGDSDTTNGNWSTQQNVTANAGTVTTSAQILTQYKITTGTGTQDWQVTWGTARDSIAAYISLTPESFGAPTVTGTADGSVSVAADAAGSVTEAVTSGTADGAVTVSADAVGTVVGPTTGTADGSVDVTGAANGTVIQLVTSGTADGSVAVSADAAGSVTQAVTSGTAAGSASVAGAANGTVIQVVTSGTAAGAASVAGDAAGTVSQGKTTGTAAGAASVAGVAIGAVIQAVTSGTAAGSVSVAGAATGGISTGTVSAVAAGYADIVGHVLLPTQAPSRSGRFENYHSLTRRGQTGRREVLAGYRDFLAGP